MDEFRKLVQEERAKLKVDPKWNDFLNNIDETPPKINQNIPSAPQGIENDPLYIAWKETNVLPHGQEGFNMVNIKVHNGDITSDTARALADITDIFSASDIRISISQNLILRWVPTEALPALYAALYDLDLANPGAEIQ